MAELDLKATPEQEDFEGKYTEEGNASQGFFIGKRLVDGYFNSVDKLIQAAPTDKFGVALEVGAGAGHSTEKLRELLPESVDLEASEYVPELVKILEDKFSPDMKILEESVYELEREDSSIDLIFLLEVLEHLDYPDKALAEIKRVSKYLILGVPREPLWRVLNMARLKYLTDLGNTPGHFNHWSKGGIVKFVTQHYGDVIAVQSPTPWTILLAKRRDN